MYLTWDYGPERTSLSYICPTGGSCAFATGDLNVVIQRSTDQGKTWSAMSPVSPRFPASGGDSAPLVVEPSGRIDVLYQGYRITDPTTYTMKSAYSYFTASTDGGRSWSPPVKVGSRGGVMSKAEWWIDGAIGMDDGGDLYATWDSQRRDRAGGSHDVGWLSSSTDGGSHWSDPVQVPADRKVGPHVMEVVGGGAEIAYVSWFSNSDPRGYARYLRIFSIAGGWLSGAVRVSRFGNTAIWPGDTFGISALSPDEVILSWGSAVPASAKRSHIFAATVRVG